MPRAIRVTSRHVAGEPLGEVHGGGLALERGVRGQDDLLERRRRRSHALGHALEELADPQPVRPDAVHGRDGAMEHVVAAPEGAGALERQHVERLLDHAQAVVVTRSGRGRSGRAGRC